MRIFKKFLANLIPTPKTDQVAFFVDSNDGKLTRKESNGSLAKYVPESGKKVYKALLSQSGTDAPTAIVLENTLGGEVVWTRDSAGLYYGTLVGGFPTDKSLCYVGTYYEGVIGTSIMVGAIIYNNNSVQVTTNYGAPSYAGDDNLLYNTSISIEVYP